jgi:hypothetical protein
MTDRPTNLLIWAQIKQFQTKEISSGVFVSGYNKKNLQTDPNLPNNVVYGFDIDEGVERGDLNELFYQITTARNYLVERCNRPEQYTNSTKPTPNDIARGFGPGSMIYISNVDTGGCVVFSDGSNWRKIKDNSIVE